MKSRIAIIPARAGSKRIKNKNIKDFCGKPIISYILDTANKSKLFEKIHVSTEDEKTSNIVSELGYKIDFMRPKRLSDSFTPIMPVVKYVIEEYKKNNILFDEVWVLMACSPLLLKSDLIKASKVFDEKKNSESLIAITEYPVPIEWAFSLNRENILKPIYPGKFSIRSQDFKKKYYDAGMFFAYNYEKILNSYIDGSDLNHLGYVISKENAIDIDDINDWRLAEKLYKVRELVNFKNK